MENENPATAKSSRNRNRVQIAAPADDSSTSNGTKRGVAFHRSSSIFRYPPAVWNEEEEEGEVEWDEDDIEIEESPVKDESTPPEVQHEADAICTIQSPVSLPTSRQPGDRLYIIICLLRLPPVRTTPGDPVESRRCFRLLLPFSLLYGFTPATENRRSLEGGDSLVLAHRDVSSSSPSGVFRFLSFCLGAGGP